MQDYKLISFEKSDFQDNHGNYWCTAAFEGIGEPVKWVAKDPMKMKVGETYYGEVKTMTSKAGKPYLRFYRATKPDNHGGNSYGGGSNKDNGKYEDRSDGMRQGMCFNNATLFVNLMYEMKGDEKPSPEQWAQDVHAHAQALYALGDLKQPTELAHDNLANAGLVQQDTVITDIDEDKPINLDDIPF